MRRNEYTARVAAVKVYDDVLDTDAFESCFELRELVTGRKLPVVTKKPR